MTISEYGLLYGHRLASIIGETETGIDCRRLILPGSLEVQRGEEEFELVPFEHKMLVYIVFDPAKHDPDKINIAATQILAAAGSTDQAVWNAAVVSSTLLGVINE
jgi:hypothetical protein